MADYIDVEEAVGRGGLRLALTAGFPGPWGEAAKGIFHVKGIPFTRVRQVAGLPNEALRQWTGRRNAPMAVYENEEPRDGWMEILWLAERLEPEPALVPADAEDRIRMFGLARELCGENGFGWLRRLQMIEGLMKPGERISAETPDGARQLGTSYGYSPEAAEAASARVAEILGLLSTQLLAQQTGGRQYFIGDGLTALDIYWATFAALYEPMPEPECAFPAPLRQMYTVTDETIRATADPALLEHRRFVYEKHLGLPMEF